MIAPGREAYRRFVTALTYFPGFILIGIATMRAGVLPQWPARALAVGALGTLGALAGPGAIARSITIGGSMFLGVGFAWPGYELLTVYNDRVQHLDR